MQTRIKIFRAEHLTFKRGLTTKLYLCYIFLCPIEIDFGYLKFLLLFYSEQNALTSENIIFCFEKYRVGIDESLDNLLKYLDYNYIKVQNGDDDSSYRPKKYIKMSDADKNDLVCKLFDIYIKNCKIKVRSDDFNKAKEARNKYLTKEYLKTITEKENQQTVIDSNKNEVSNNEIKNTNSNDLSSIIILKIIGHVFTLGIFIWIPFLFNIIFGDCCSCIKTGITNKDNRLINYSQNGVDLKNKDKAEDKIGMEDNNLNLN